MAVVALVAWLLTASAGIVVLAAWLRGRRRGARFPARLVGLHLVTGVAGLSLWLGHVFAGSLSAGWLAFAVLNVNNGLGDAILTGRVRAVAGVRSTWLRDYGRALGAVLRGRRPPVAVFHGLAAGVTYFLTLAACVLATW